MLVTVDSCHRERVSSGELVTKDGRTVPLPSLELDPGSRTWGGAIPMNLHDVAAIRLLGEVLGASIGRPGADG
jgi:hypothetical protein